MKKPIKKTEANLKLLTRDNFREGVFARDKHQCVFCSASAPTALYAHHILERRLFPDGGYYLENGVTVCNEHHLQCEMTLISVEDVRLKANITQLAIPPHLYPDIIYDKWGNPVLDNGLRLKGELFHDESVQKILNEGNVLDLFTEQVKYPRTYHFEWSGCIRSDDRVLHDLSGFHNQRVIVTLKMDGENTSMYHDYIHARSIDGRSHESRNWIKNFWSRIKQDIPKGYRVCCENLYAEHSIAYDALTTYCMGFSFWNDLNQCLSWDETIQWFELLGITPVEVIYDGIFDEKLIKNLVKTLDLTKNEGIVVRVADAFPYIDFNKKVVKYVRPNHVQTEKHWMYGQAVKPNLLKK